MNIAYEITSADLRYSWIIVEDSGIFRTAIKISDLVIFIGYDGTLNNCIQNLNNILT